MNKPEIGDRVKWMGKKGPWYGTIVETANVYTEATIQWDGGGKISIPENYFTTDNWYGTPLIKIIKETPDEWADCFQVLTT